MPEYVVTFGSQYGGQDYGADPHPVGGYGFVHRDGYWTIVAADEDAARELAVAVLGTGWSNLYSPSQIHADWSTVFPRGELLRLVHPAMRDQAVHLLVADMPSAYFECEGDRGVGAMTGRLLVTVWGNGTGEVAWREDDDPQSRWGIPSTLEPAP